MIYFLSCALHEGIPEEAIIAQTDLKAVYSLAKRHSLSAICYYPLDKVNGILPDDLRKKWSNEMHRNARRNSLFAMERAKLTAFCEEQEIWYMPLKGCIMQQFYPAGCREMADNDILFDEKHDEEIKTFFEAQGYAVESFRLGNHDVYEKMPMYNFEMHRSLFGEPHKEIWEQYYRNVFEKLIPDEGKKYAYHFSKEDFYIFLMVHAYKHYYLNGTGLRSLVDCFVYNRSHTLDRSYVDAELTKLGILEYEKESKALADKLFSNPSEAIPIVRSLSEDEQKILSYYVTSGTYGTQEHRIENQLGELSKDRDPNFFTRIRLMWRKVFPPKREMRSWCKLHAGFFLNHRWLMFLAPLYRLFYKMFTDFGKIQKILRLIWKKGTKGNSNI